MTFDRARAVADAVLFEGYVLYPYRATAPKNQFRWAFGVLAPEAWGGCEPSWMRTQCLVAEGATVEGRLRFLRVVRRAVEVEDDGTFREVAQLELGDRLLVTWEEGEIEEIPFTTSTTFALPGAVEVEPFDGARVVRRREPVQGRISVTRERVRPGLDRLTVQVDNHTPSEPGLPRDVALRSACVGAHLLLASSGGDFVSVLDEPDLCAQVRCWPVLAGPPGQRDLVLASPIILYDHPQVAPESPGDFFDACEIDELLTLRTATLTPEEKRQARATDPRAAALIDRVDHLPPELVGRLHGATRDLSGGEMVPRQEVVHDAAAAAAAGFDVGAKVRLRPGARRTDAQDLLYVGMIATVRAVRQDVDGSALVAVTIDDDPAGELHHWYGRFHWYRPDELEAP